MGKHQEMQMVQRKADIKKQLSREQTWSRVGIQQVCMECWRGGKKHWSFFRFCLSPDSQPHQGQPACSSCSWISGRLAMLKASQAF